MEPLVRWRYLTTSASGRREIRASTIPTGPYSGVKETNPYHLGASTGVSLRAILERRVPLASESAYYYGRSMIVALDPHALAASSR